METIALIAVDLDGTLLTSDNTLAPEGARLLGRAAQSGIRVVLATTRNPHSVQALCRQMGLCDPMICRNGAQVWGSPDGPVWACHTIPLDVALAIARLVDAHGWELSATVGSMSYWRRRPGQSLGLSSLTRTVVATNVDAIVGEPVRMLVSQPEAVGAIVALCQSFAGRCYAATFYEPDGRVHSLSITSPRANKGAALTLVLDRLGISREHVMAIGDNPNDLPMLACARIRVAMGNATDDVKQQATIVAPSNDEEGVAWALRNLGVVSVDPA